MGNRSVTWFSALALVPEGERSLLALLLEVSPASAASMLNVYLPLLHEDACLSMWMEEEIQLHFSSLEEK